MGMLRSDSRCPFVFRSLAYCTKLSYSYLTVFISKYRIYMSYSDLLQTAPNCRKHNPQSHFQRVLWIESTSAANTQLQSVSWYFPGSPYSQYPYLKIQFLQKYVKSILLLFQIIQKFMNFPRRFKKSMIPHSVEHPYSLTIKILELLKQTRMRTRAAINLPRHVRPTLQIFWCLPFLILFLQLCILQFQGSRQQNLWVRRIYAMHTKFICKAYAGQVHCNQQRGAMYTTVQVRYTRQFDAVYTTIRRTVHDT